LEIFFPTFGPLIALVRGTARKNGENAMTPRTAVGILMLSPVYFKLTLQARLHLVREFCAGFSSGQSAATNH
jgi:hypothetical protein